MKIGLIRHFSVKHAFPGKTFLYYEELVRWFEEYDAADIDYAVVDLCGINWHVCYSSATSRAVKTAEHIFDGNIIQLEELRELQFLPLVNTKLKLPLFLWAMFIRNRALSSNALTNEMITRLRSFVNTLMNNKNKNVLICSHGFVMMFLQKELIRRGFNGDKFNTPANGRIYLFEK
ncbi:MAG TPA: histidine phosphatase family protein [Flavisolibacter sp.]|jgi:broad specificity phosphatase PhoE|nr:histidine phosphatase family protein [Flavisolibacter sp.]